MIELYLQLDCIESIAEPVHVCSCVSCRLDMQDHKTRSIEYSHSTCLWIVQVNCMYVHVMGVFSLFLFFSQVDFALVRLLADWIVTGYSTVWFIQVWCLLHCPWHTPCVQV